MKKNIFLICTIMMVQTISAFKIDGVGAKVKEPHKPVRQSLDSFFKKERFYLNNITVCTDPLNLQQAARDALRYLSVHTEQKKAVADPFSFRKFISLEETKNTLRFVINCIEADKKTGHFRILNQHFLNKHFKGISWHADTDGALKHNIKLPETGNIRLTCYAIFQGAGSYRKTPETPCALYYIKDRSIAKKFTKQQILAGALEHQEYRTKVKPLAWVSRQTFEDALMQGTIVVTFPDGNQKVLGVSVNNDIPYDRSEKDVYAQKRYWFFSRVKGTHKTTKETIKKIKQRKHVIFAGDIHHIGLGKLIGVTHTSPITGKPEIRLGILADTGGAFRDNLYQLDYFVGITANKQTIKSELAALPPTTQAFVLYKPLA